MNNSTLKNTKHNLVLWMSLLLLTIASLISTSTFAQENPWETKATKSPWGTQPQKQNETNSQDSINLKSQFSDADIQSTTIEFDTTGITTIPSKQIIVECQATQNSNSIKSSPHLDSVLFNSRWYFTEDLDNETLDFIQFKGTKAINTNASFWTAFVTCGIFNVLAVPPNLIGSSIPTTKMKKAVKKFKNDNPHLPKEAIKKYKNGIQGTRTKKSFLGCISGITVNIAILFGLISRL